MNLLRMRVLKRSKHSCWVARGLGWRHPHGERPLVLTAQKDVAWLFLNIVASVNASFASSLATATSQAALSLSGGPVLMWITNGVCDEHQNVFLLKPGCRTTPGWKEVESFFGPWDFKEDDSWQMHHYWWPLVLFWGLGLNWRVMLINHLSFVSFTENSWARSRGAVSFILYSAVSFILFLHENLHVFNKSFYCRGAHVWGVSSAPRWFPWEGLICPLLQKGETVQPYYFLALPWPGCHMTWPTVNLDSQNPQNSTLFFLCILCSFSPLGRGWGGGVAIEWRSFITLACLLGRYKKNPTELIPACWCIPPWDPSPAYLTPQSVYIHSLLSG